MRMQIQIGQHLCRFVKAHMRPDSHAVRPHPIALRSSVHRIAFLKKKIAQSYRYPAQSMSYRPVIREAVAAFSCTGVRSTEELLRILWISGEEMGSLLVIALCSYPNSFRFISDSPFEGAWKAAALCSVILSVEFCVLLWQRRRHRSPMGWKTTALVAATSIGTAGLAIFAGRHAMQGLPCFGAPGLHPSFTEVQQANIAYQTLAVVDALTVLACIATCCILVVDGIRLFRQP